MHRVTVWYDDEGQELQWSLACLDDAWEPYCEVTEPAGPFHPVPGLPGAVEHVHALFPGPAGRAHQLALF